MSLIQLPKNYHPDFAIPNQQPRNPSVIDWENDPIAKGLWGAYAFINGSLVNLVNGNTAAVLNGTVTKEIDHGSQVLEFNVTNGDGFLLNNGAINSGNITVLTNASYDSLTIDHALLDINNQQLITWADTFSSQLRTTSFGGSSTNVGSTGGLDTTDGEYVSWGTVFDRVAGTTFSQSYINGIADGSRSAVGTGSGYITSPNIAIGNNFSSNSKRSDGRYEFIFIWNRALSSAEVSFFNRNYYHRLKPVVPQFYFTPDISAAVTGTISETLSDVTISASGVVPYTGTIIQTLANVTSTASGTLTVLGSISETLDSTTSAISGQVGLTVTGTISETLDNFTSTSSGILTVTGTVVETLGNTTSVTSGTILTTGTISETLEDFTSAISGIVAGGIFGTIGITLDDVLSVASGIVPITGGLFSNETMIAFFRQQTGLDTYQFNELAKAYYAQAASTDLEAFNDLQRAAQQAAGFVGLAPTDWRNL